MSESIPGLLALVVLLAANGFFVGAEFAVISARRSQIEPKADAGDKRAKTALWAMEHATLMLSTCQLGITFCSIIILLVSEPAVHHLLEIPLQAVGAPDSFIGPFAFIVTLLLVTYLHVVIGEMVPKNMAFSIPETAVLWLAPPLVMISRALKPVIWFMDAIANRFLRLVGVEPKRGASSTFTFDQIATIVEESTSLGTLEDESGMLAASFEFSDLTVGDLMVPISDIVHLPATSSPNDIQQATRANGYSRYLLADESGVPTGYVHVKDMLSLTSPERMQERIPESVVRPLRASSRSDEIEDVFTRMRAESSHVQTVVDGSGDVVGLVFLEDILEELIGEVHDATQAGTVSPGTA